MANSGRPHVIISVLTYLLAFVPFIFITWWLTAALPAKVAGLAMMWNSSTYGTWQFWNWHPMLMTSGFGLLATHAIISFKALPFSHSVKKVIHVVSHIAAFTCACVGFSAVVLFKNSSGNNHFYTVHAWLGLGAFSLYGLQILLGLIFFVFPKPSERIRAAFLPLHTFFGLAIYICTIMALVSGALDRILITQLSWDPASPIWRGANGFMISCVLAMFGVMWHTRASKKKEDDVAYQPINTVGTLEYN